jgi:hypothetical protein
MRRVTLAAVLAVLPFATPVFADEAQSFRFIGASGVGKTTLMSVLHDRGQPKRFAISSPDGPKIVFMLDGAETVIVVNDRDQEYFDMAEMAQTMKAMGLGGGTTTRVPPELAAAQDVMRSKMQEILDKTPESQRAMVQKALEAQLGVTMAKPEPPRGPLTAETTGDTDRIGGLDVTRWLMRRDGETVGEVWAANPDDVDGGAVLLAAMTEAGTLLAQIMGDMAPAAVDKAGVTTDAYFLALGGIDGFPVELTSKDETWSFDGLDADVDALDQETWATYRRRSMKP